MRMLIFTIAAMASLVFGNSPVVAESPLPISLSAEKMPVLFGTAWCPYCKAARHWFKVNNLAFINCDVETSKRCGADYKALRKSNRATGVPAIVYRGHVWGGYDEDQMFEIAELVDMTRAVQPK
jgi:glutaredoxin 3